MVRQSLAQVARQALYGIRHDAAQAGPSVSTFLRRASTIGASDSAPASYPFSANAVFPPSIHPEVEVPKKLLRPKHGETVIHHVNQAMRAQLDPKDYSGTFFHRRWPGRVRPGSVLSVSTWNSMAKTHSTSFSGVLMGVRRGGVETSFILRNVINKLGVEMTFKVCSPLIKDIQIVKRARGNGKAKPGAPTGLREFRRAKTYFIRDRPEVLRNIANVLKLERPNK